MRERSMAWPANRLKRKLALLIDRFESNQKGKREMKPRIRSAQVKIRVLLEIAAPA